MGWNSWNYFKCGINEKVIMSVADAIVNSGMKESGYQYIIIDDCWAYDRDSEGNIIADPDRFPSGISALADYVHSKGLKFGIYSDAGKHTCRLKPGSMNHEKQDAMTYASWGVDFLKYDWCFNRHKSSIECYSTMRDALFDAGRPVILSICEWGTTKPWEWGAQVGHMWRTTRDITDKFDCNTLFHMGILQIIEKQINIRKYSGPGGWNDLDMLEVGNPGLTVNQSRSHFSMWCMLASPLMAGNDIRNMSDEIKNIITNTEAIAIDQDSLGIPAMRWENDGGIEKWIKPLTNGNYCICILNHGDKPYILDLLLDGLTMIDSEFSRQYQIDGNFEIYDLWKHSGIGESNAHIFQTIENDDVLMIKLIRKSSTGAAHL